MRTNDAPPDPPDPAPPGDQQEPATGDDTGPGPAAEPPSRPEPADVEDVAMLLREIRVRDALRRRNED